MAVERYFDAETVWVSEIDKYASQLIDARINKPNLGNLKVIDWATVEPIDVLTAGLLCTTAIAWTITCNLSTMSDLLDLSDFSRLSYPQLDKVATLHSQRGAP